MHRRQWGSIRVMHSFFWGGGRGFLRRQLPRAALNALGHKPVIADVPPDCSNEWGALRQTAEQVALSITRNAKADCSPGRLLRNLSGL